MAKAKPAKDDALTEHTELILSLSEIGFSGFERLSTLSMALAKTVFDDGLENSRTLADMKDINDMMNISPLFGTKATEQLMDYFRGVQQITTDVQEQVFSIMNQQMALFGGSPTVANPMVEIFTKFAAQSVEMTTANLKTVAESVEAAVDAAEPEAEVAAKEKKIA